jgi:hypothetical protein
MLLSDYAEYQKLKNAYEILFREHTERGQYYTFISFDLWSKSKKRNNVSLKLVIKLFSSLRYENNTDETNNVWHGQNTEYGFSILTHNVEFVSKPPPRPIVSSHITNGILGIIGDTWTVSFSAYIVNSVINLGHSDVTIYDECVFVSGDYEKFENDLTHLVVALS